MEGNTKLKIHMSNEIQRIFTSITSKRAKIKIATAPFKTASKSDITGIMEANKYMAVIAEIASK